MSKPKYNNLISKTTSKLNNSFIISGYLDSDIGGPPDDRDLTTAEALSVLYEEIDKTDFQQIFKGSPNEYISSLVAFPIDILSILKMNFPNEERKPLYVRGNKISRTRRVIQSDETLTVYGFDCSKDLQFYLGHIEYPYSKSNKFYHRNGYTRLQLFLPYLGFVELSPNDFCDPYSHINIILSVDPKSASATYYIYASNSPMYSTTSSTVPRNYYIGNRPVLSTLTRLVAQYAIELGIKIPIGATNATENARNILLGAIKAGAAIASAGTSMAVGAGISTATSTATETVVKKGRAMQTVGRATSEGGRVTKPLTDRLYKAGEKKTTKEGSRTVDSSSYYKGKAVNECFSAFTEGVSSLFSNGSCDRINATSGLYNSPIKPFLQVFVPKIKSDEGYGDIYGKPLGVVRELSGLSGYTEIAKIHIEGEDFESATREEIGMLGNALSDGIILPNSRIWILNNEIKTPVFAGASESVNIDFTSNGKNYKRLYWNTDASPTTGRDFELMYSQNEEDVFDGDEVCYGTTSSYKNWADKKYRVIEFNEPINKYMSIGTEKEGVIKYEDSSLHNWLKDNAVSVNPNSEIWVLNETPQGVEAFIPFDLHFNFKCNGIPYNRMVNNDGDYDSVSFVMENPDGSPKYIVDATYLLPNGLCKFYDEYRIIVIDEQAPTEAYKWLSYNGDVLGNRKFEIFSSTNVTTNKMRINGKEWVTVPYGDFNNATLIEDVETLEVMFGNSSGYIKIYNAYSFSVIQSITAGANVAVNVTDTIKRNKLQPYYIEMVNA